MSKPVPFHPSDRWILSHRSGKNRVDPEKPYLFFNEPERTAGGEVAQFTTVFLTNNECPFRCLMCDLWKNTLDTPTPRGAIPAQIEWARSQLPPTRHIKLYNSGNFFDPHAVPVEDYPRIAAAVSDMQSIVVECHPKLVGDRVFRFQDRLQGRLEVAMGLETTHPEVLPQLNKRMTLADFEYSVASLQKRGLSSRAFILLRPPFMSEQEGVHWAKRSLDFALGLGVECCVVIPTRAGNGAMEQLRQQGSFYPPSLESLEEVLAYGIKLRQGRVFADLWDLPQFASCPQCLIPRRDRLHSMNLGQSILPNIACSCRQNPTVSASHPGNPGSSPTMPEFSLGQ